MLNRATNWTEDKSSKYATAKYGCDLLVRDQLITLIKKSLNQNIVNRFL